MHGAVKANLDLSSYVVEEIKWISFSQNFVSSALSHALHCSTQRKTFSNACRNDFPDMQI
jgi:hypothetical protein